jgi:hypothetical protein
MVLRHVLIYYRILTNLYVTICTQEAEKARQYDRQLKQMKAERDKAEKVLMEQLEQYGEEDNEYTQSRQLIRNFQKKVNKSVKDNGTEQITKKKTKSQPKRIAKKKTMKKKIPTRKDLSDDEATETEPDKDTDEEVEAEADMDSDEEVEAEVDSDEAVEAEVDSDKEVDAEVDSDKEVDAEVDSDKGAESDAEEIKIKSHHFVKGVCWVKTKFADEDGIIEVEVWWLWYEFKNQLREYIKRRKLRGNAWKEPNANHATKIVAVLGHRGKQLHILWNNGYHEWATEKIILAEKQSFVKDDLLDVYWQGQKKEPVKKSKMKKSKKK